MGAGALAVCALVARARAARFFFGARANTAAMLAHAVLLGALASFPTMCDRLSRCGPSEACRLNSTENFYICFDMTTPCGAGSGNATHLLESYRASVAPSLAQFGMDANALSAVQIYDIILEGLKANSTYKDDPVVANSTSLEHVCLPYNDPERYELRFLDSSSVWFKGSLINDTRATWQFNYLDNSDAPYSTISSGYTVGSSFCMAEACHFPVSGVLDGRRTGFKVTQPCCHMSQAEACEHWKTSYVDGGCCATA